MNMNRIVPDLLRRYLPILAWGAEYSRRTLASDLIAAAIVTIMLIPQSLAYALLVGLPAQVGLYASMAPLVLYAIFGTSRALAVGPVAVASLMTAAAAGTGRGPGNAGVSGGGHRARHGRGAHAGRHGGAAAGVSRELSQPPRHLGLHHGRGRPDRGGPGRAPSRHPRARRESPGPADLACAQPRQDQSLHRGDRPRFACLSLLGAPRPQAPPAPRRARRDGPRTSWRRWAPPWPSS